MDLLIDPGTRGVNDVSHVVAAVASSSSKSEAEKLISEIVAPKQQGTPCAAYGSYEELAEDSNVDIVYIATPHSHHYQNCMLILKNNKAVLCEKPLTVNAKQAEALYQEAKSRSLFFMDAVWTRFFPLSITVRELIQSGQMGDVLRAQADLSVGIVPEDKYDVSNRVVNKDLAGGCLLELGIYSLTWLFQAIYHTVPEEKRRAPRVIGTVVTPEARTGVDESTTVLLEFPVSPPTGKTKTHGIALASLRADYDIGKHTTSAIPAVRIQGEKGEIQVFGGIYRPQRMRVIFKESENRQIEDTTFDFPGDGHGLYWEADEAARCFLGGNLQSKGLPWEESILIMQVMDEVRKQGRLTYPEEIETTDYPVDLKGRR